MSHLLADLGGYHDPYWAALFLLITAPGVGAILLVLRSALAARGGRRTVLEIAGGLATAPMSLLAFLPALKSCYPQIEIAIPATDVGIALATSTVCSFLAFRIATEGRRSSRNVLLAGSLQAFGLSCMVFTCMAGIVRPYALSYDLGAVLVVMIFGSMLAGFAVWESGNAVRRNPLLVATLLGTGAVTCVMFGSVACILAFGDWMSAVAEVDDLTASPIIVIGAAEAAVCLALGMLGSFVDNRAAARDKREADRLRELADSTFEAIVIHRGGVLLDGNEALATLLGLPNAQLAGLDMRSFVSAEGEPFPVAIASPRRMEGEIVVRDGARLPVEMLLRPIRYRGDHAVVTALRDISERRASEARMRFLAHHDMLTELPNRALLTDRLNDAVAASAQTGQPLAVLALDLDGFKLVNDSLGHAAGDRLLQLVAGRLKDCLSEGEFAARVGGDEFVLLQPGRAQPANAGELAQRVIASLSAPFDLDARRVGIGTSIGIAIHPTDGNAADRLLKRADIALYRAKHSGRGCFRFFDAWIDQPVDDRPQLESELRSALAKGELSLVYQPIVDADARLVCFESLMRWTHPALGAISPARFIPIAEESGLIVGMGEWAMRAACQAAAAWPVAHRVAVNLSPIQLLNGGLVRLVQDVLDETGLLAERLELELTEGVLVQDAEAASAVVGELRRMGVRIVLDDFGTGYSSLSYLHRFQFQKLKIDRSFVARLDEDRNAQAIVKAIVSMSRELGIAVTAEGVETSEQLLKLRALGCDELQGYLFSRPLPAPDADAFIAARGAEDNLARLHAARRSLRSESDPVVSAA